MELGTEKLLDKLKAKVVNSGKSLRVIGKEIELDHSNVQRAINGTGKTPLDTIVKISQAVGLELTFIDKNKKK